MGDALAEVVGERADVPTVEGDLSPRQPRLRRQRLHRRPPQRIPFAADRLPPLLVCSERADDRALVGTRRLDDEAERLDAAAAAGDERRLQRTQRQRRADVAATTIITAVVAAAAAEG